jgi:hypothetical protein
VTRLWIGEIKVSWFNSPYRKMQCLKLSGSSNLVGLPRTVTLVKLLEPEWEDDFHPKFRYFFIGQHGIVTPKNAHLSVFWGC